MCIWFGTYLANASEQTRVVSNGEQKQSIFRQVAIENIQMKHLAKKAILTENNLILDSFNKGIDFLSSIYHEKRVEPWEKHPKSNIVYKMFPFLNLIKEAHVTIV